MRDNGLVVWIPERVEDFDYEAGKVPNPARQDDVRASLENAGANQKANAWDGSSAKPQRLQTAEPVMPAESRRVIAVRAGADARYDLIARQTLGWARAALWCYALAMVLVVVVLYDQSVAILHETGLQGLSNTIRLGLPTLCFVAVAAILVWLVIDALSGWLWPIIRPPLARYAAQNWERLKDLLGKAASRVLARRA